MDIKDAKVIVTGAASGMGRHFAMRLAELGAQVVAADVSQEGLDSLVAESESLAGAIHGIKANVASEDEVVALIKGSVEVMGGLNGLINNAGIFRDGMLVKKDRKTGDIKKMSLKNWQTVIDVDLTGPFLCTREFAAHILESGEKSSVIINISSVSRHGNRGQTNYSAAKAGLVADTKLWSLELARYGVRVAAIAPGFVATPLLEGMRPEVLEKIVAQVPVRRLGSTEEMFMGVKFIMECDYFTGRCLDIDGGLIL